MKRFQLLFRNYRLRSIVVRNFVVSVCLSILSAGMFYCFTTQIFQEQYQENVQVSYLNLLGSVASTMDAKLGGVAESMSMSMRDEDIIRATLNPDPENYFRSRNITNLLSMMLVENSDMIDRAYYYVWNIEKAYTSEEAVINREELVCRDLLDLLDSSPESFNEFTVGKLRTKLYIKEDVIYLFQDFPLEKRLGTMICTLDMEQLFQGVLGNHSDTSSLYIFSEKGDALFSQFQTYPQAHVDMDLSQPQDSKAIKLDGKGYYLHLGTQPQWLYLHRVNPTNASDGMVNHRMVGMQVLPFLILFLLISLMVSIYNTLGIYTPMNRLMKSVQPEEEALVGHRDEFDFLNHSYQNIVSRAGQYSANLQAVAPAVLRNLFNNLIMGRETDQIHIQETLDSLNNPFHMEARYLVLVTRVIHKSTARLSETESNLCQLQLQMLLDRETTLRHSTNYDLFTDYRGDFVLVLSFRQETKQTLIQATVDDLRHAFEVEGAQWDYQMMIGVGQVCEQLYNISESYGYALQQVREEQYLLTDPSAVEAQEVEEATFGLNDIEYDAIKQLLKQLLQNLDGEHTQQARKDLSDLIDEIEQAVRVPDIGDHFAYIIDTLTERAAPLVARQEGESLLDKETIFDKLHSRGLEEAVAFVKEYCAQLIHLIETNASKKQNRYIVAANEHIAENYMDSSLSVNSTSEYIGIHASYLGRLFRDHLGEPFTNYLNEYRIKVAMQLLTSTNLSVTEIGFKTGFNSAQSFIRVFKKHVGTTPGQYREKTI